MDNCYLRKALKDDLEILFEWANEKEVRKNSISTGEISFDEHKEWFRNKLVSENCDIYILCKDEIPIGQIRLDYNGSHAVISYSICSKYRGQGYGRMMLVLAEEKVRQTRMDIRVFDAEVKVENIASKKKFEELGYKSIELIRYQKNIIEPHLASEKVQGFISGGVRENTLNRKIVLIVNSSNIIELIKYEKINFCCKKENLISIYKNLQDIVWKQIELICNSFDKGGELYENILF